MSTETISATAPTIPTPPPETVYYRGVGPNGYHFETADGKTQLIYPNLTLALEAFRIHGRDYVT